MARPILPNSPLVEVVFEMRFAGDLAFQAAWPKLQEELREDYPALFVPGAVAGTSPLLQPLQLASADHKQKVLLAVNSFAVSTHKYASFETFVSVFGRAYEAFQRHCRPLRYTRLGLRYINLLPRDFDNETALPGRIHPCLKLALTGWNGLPPVASETPQFVYQGSRDQLELRLGLYSPGDRASETRLDLDCFEQGEELDPSRVIPFLDDAHTLVEEAFFAIIDDSYHRYLEGKV